MTHARPHQQFTHLISAAAFVVLMLSPHVTPAQERSPGLLDNLFNRGERASPPPQPNDAPGMTPGMAQGQPASTDPSDPSVRLDRVENALRQLTGTIEQLQFRNQQLEMQLKRMQEDTEYRFQQLGGKGASAPGAIPMNAPPAAAPMNAPPSAMPPMNAPSAATPGRRGDVFDPAQHPNAPGAPRILGNQSAALPPPNADDAPPMGAPGGRAAGAPLDLATLAGNAAAQPPVHEAPGAIRPQASPLPPPQNANAGRGAQLATLPPSAKPQDEYDLAYGYVLHKDYSLAEQAFRDFLAKYPNERAVPDAQYWLGESLFQQQRYRDAAESFLAVSTKYEHAGKAPDSLLRLGQSLAALHKKEAACATLTEVNRKFPRASASVKRTVAQELKRVHC